MKRTSEDTKTLADLPAVRTGLVDSRDRKVSGAIEPGAEDFAAYREGRLPPVEAEMLEWSLSHSPETRARMAELAGVTPPVPNPRVREAVLATFDIAARTRLVAMGLSVQWLVRSLAPLLLAVGRFFRLS